MLRLIILAAAMCAWLPAAQAETLLHLSDTETVSVMPDELAASLSAQASSASPAEAQQRVNAMIADALAHVRKVAGVTFSTGAYNVWHVGPTGQDPSERWHANQALELSTHDGTALLALVGTLQANGLAVDALTWRLSRPAERKAHEEALRAAIAALRGKATEAAGLLGLRFDSFKDVRLGQSMPPMPRFMGAVAAMAATAAAPPSAVAAQVPVSATAEAEAILLAK